MSHTPSPMVWSVQRLYNGRQYINQDVDKVKHPTSCQVPLLCIVTCPPKSTPSQPHPSLRKRRVLAAFPPHDQRQPKLLTEGGGQSPSHEPTPPPPAMPLTLTFTQLPYTSTQWPWDLNFSPGLQNERVKKKTLRHAVLAPRCAEICP